MDRRNLLVAGAALTAAGLAGASKSTQAATGSSPTMPSVFDFGAVGNGSTDDSAAFQRALNATVGAGKFLLIPPYSYMIAKPLAVTLTQNFTSPFGIHGQGATLISGITTGRAVINITSNAIVRNLVVEGFKISGYGGTGNGLVLAAPTGNVFLAQACLRDLYVEGCGGDGIRLFGNVFESNLYNCYAMDSKGNGLTIQNSDQGGVISAIRVFGGSFTQSGQCGALLTGPASNFWAAPYDVSFHGTYFRNNGQWGVNAINGISSLYHCGFENNWGSAGSVGNGNAGISLNNFGLISGCTGASNQFQTGLINTYVIGRLTMMNCFVDGEGVVDMNLGTFNGQLGAEIILINCDGTPNVASGIAAQIKTFP